MKEFQLNIILFYSGEGTIIVFLSRGSQSNAIERRFLIESIEPNRTQSFDWFSIVFGNRKPIKLLHLFNDWFDWFDVRLHSITIRLCLITIRSIRFSTFFFMVLHSFSAKIQVAIDTSFDLHTHITIFFIANIPHLSSLPAARWTEGFYHETFCRSTNTHRVLYNSLFFKTWM